jgi:hypothetical protein
MNASYELLDAALIDLLGMTGEYVVWEGIRIKAVVSPVQLQDQWMDGGHNATRGATIVARKKDFRGGSPSVGDMVSTSSVAYQVIRVDDDGPGYTLTASTPTV